MTLVFEKNMDTKKIFFLIFGIVFIVFLFTSDGHRYTMDEDMGAQMALGMVTLEPHPDYVEGGTKKIVGEKVELSCAPEWESRTFQTTDMNSWPYLRKLDIPVYVICGNINSTFTPKARKAAKKLGKNWQIEVFPEASHSLPMELGQELIDRIHQFMSK